jgi:hypothetical protein
MSHWKVRLVIAAGFCAFVLSWSIPVAVWDLPSGEDL